MNVEYEHFRQRDVPHTDVAETIGSRVNPALGITYDKTQGGLGYAFSFQGPDAYRDGNYRTLSTDATVLLNERFSLNFATMQTAANQDDFRVRDVEDYARDLRGEAGAANQASPRARLQYRRNGGDNFALRLQLLGNFEFGSAIKNKTLIVYNETDGFGYNFYRRLPGFVVQPGFAIPDAIKQQVYALPYDGESNTSRSDSNSWRVTTITSALSERLHVILGAQAQENYSRALRGAVSDTEGDTYQAGATFGLTPDVTVFANYGDDFSPNNAQGRGGTILTTPQRGEGYDFGVKTSLLNKRLTGTVAYFWQERANIPNRITERNPVTGAQESYFVLAGVVEHNGIEFDLVWDATPEVQLMLNGSFFDAQTVQNLQTPAEVGRPPEDTIQNMLSWQARYSSRSGMLKGWTFGFGGYWHDSARAEGNFAKLNVQFDDHYILTGFVARSFAVGQPAAKAAYISTTCSTSAATSPARRSSARRSPCAARYLSVFDQGSSVALRRPRRMSPYPSKTTRAQT